MSACWAGHTEAAEGTGSAFAGSAVIQAGQRAEWRLEGRGLLCYWLTQEYSWGLGKWWGTRLQVKPEENINLIQIL